jgi:hypothetical protein
MWCLVEFYQCIKVRVIIVGRQDSIIWQDIWPSSSGLRDRRRTYFTILKRAWSAKFKMVCYVLLRPLRPELDGQDPFQICGGLCQTRKTPTLDENVFQTPQSSRKTLSLYPRAIYFSVELEGLNSAVGKSRYRFEIECGKYSKNNIWTKTLAFLMLFTPRRAGSKIKKPIKMCLEKCIMDQQFYRSSKNSL